MATRIDIVSGLDATGNANKMICCDDGCATNITTFQNVHGSALNVTTFNISDAGTNFSVTIIAINGGAPSFPFLVPDGGTFTMEFEICHVGPGTTGTWAGYFDTAEHAPDTPFGFVMDCVPATYLGYTPTTIDFVDAPVGIPVTQTITSGTQPMFTQTITLTGTGCGGVVVSPSPILLQQDVISTFDITWTPTTAGETLACSLEFCSGETIDVTGNSVAIDCDGCLCCVDVTIKTENDYLDPQSGFCDPGELYNTASFLEKKTIVFSMVYPAGINSSWRLQFNPALFLRDCEPPFEAANLVLPTGYAITYFQSSMPNGVAQPMALTGAGANANNQRNWECFFRPGDPTLGTFNVELTFYNVADLSNWLTAGVFDNLLKFTRNILSAPSDWTNSAASVYNAN
jgi:hypothetical protein